MKINRSKYRFLLLIPGLMFISYAMVAQQNYAYKNLSVEHGIAASETYTVVQDSCGYIWIGTESGISRYDGYNFKNYINSDKLVDNAILRLFVDYKNRIWYSTYNGYFGYIQNDRMYNHPLGRSMNSTLDYGFMSNSYIDSSDNIWMFNYSNGLIKIDQQNKIHTTHSISSSTKTQILRKILKNNLFRVNHHHNNSVLHKDTIIPDPDKINQHQNAFFLLLNKDEYFFAKGPGVYHVKNNNIVKSKIIDRSNPVYTISLDNRNNIWVNLDSKGLHIFPNKDLDSKPEILLKNYATSSVTQDREGNYWITTMEDGVFMLPSLDYYILPETYQKKILTFDFSNNHIYYHSYLDDIVKMNMETYENTKIQLPGKSSLVHSLSVSYDNNLLVSSIFNLLIDTTGKTLMPSTFNNLNHRLLNDSVALTSGLRHFGKYDIKNKKVILDIRNEMTIVTAYEDSAGLIWLGTLNGLCVYEHGEVKHKDSTNTFLQYRINTIEPLGEYLLLGTKAAGLGIYNHAKNHIANIIDETNGLTSNNIRSLFVENDSTIWVGSVAGLSKILITNHNPFKFHILNYNQSNGFPSREVYQIKKYDSMLYVATDNGIIRFKPSCQPQICQPPKPHIENIIINDKEQINTKDRIELKHWQNTLLIQYKAIAIRNHDQLNYRYKLENYDGKWINNKELTARYSHLEPGNYTFKIQSTLDNLHFSKEKQIHFTISKSYYQTTIFKILCILVIISVLYFVYSYLIRLQHRKDELRYRIFQSENNALRSQLHPHFIYNALCSLHDYILRMQTKEADSYISDFAGLIRLSFENSKCNFIPLKQEVETIRLYLKLEESQFNGTFEFSIEIDSSIDPETIQVPPLLIQPLLENALIHGLVPQKGQKTLKINFKNDIKSMIICEIKDNGVGRQKAGPVNKNKYWHKYRVSSGISNIGKQITLINKMYSTNMELNIEDMEERGTIVKLRMYCIT
jgi:ligand-binding sensor domain-containing protein